MHTRGAILAVAACMAVSSVSASYESVTGKELQKCSMPGMALTGYTREGKCVAHDDDAGSHHVCIDMASNTGGNFCSVTGQPDWCSSKMACDNARWKFTKARLLFNLPCDLTVRADVCEVPTVGPALWSIGVCASGRLRGTFKRRGVVTRSRRLCATLPT